MVLLKQKKLWISQVMVAQNKNDIQMFFFSTFLWATQIMVFKTKKKVIQSSKGNPET